MIADTQLRCVCGWHMNTNPGPFQSKWCPNPDAMPHHAHPRKWGEWCPCRLCNGNTEAQHTMWQRTSNWKG